MKPHTSDVLEKASAKPGVAKFQKELERLYPKTPDTLMARSGITLALFKVDEKLSVIIDKGKKPSQSDIKKILSHPAITSKLEDSKASDLLKKYADALVRELSKLLPATEPKTSREGTLTELKCKNCGAPLPSASRGKTVVCPYCGTSYLMNDIMRARVASFKAEAFRRESALYLQAHGFRISASDDKKIEHFSIEDARQAAESIGIDCAQEQFDISDLRDGMNVEIEHGSSDPMTDVGGDDPVIAGKIALAHLNESPDYYTYLADMEKKFVSTSKSKASLIVAKHLIRYVKEYLTLYRNASDAEIEEAKKYFTDLRDRSERGERLTPGQRDDLVAFNKAMEKLGHAF